MEEKKLKNQTKMKVVEGNNTSKEEQQKLTYEQLNEACSQLYQQNQNLIRQLQQLNTTNMFRRLDYLFMVLKYESVIKDADFVNACIDEIKEAIIIPTEEKEG